MQREIKFRAWDKLRREMVYFDDLYWFEENFVSCVPDFRYILQQYTGLKDDNEKDIYEGDILKISNGERLVADLIDVSLIPKESYIVRIERSNMGEYYGSNSKTSWYSFLDYDSWEVIGNIFENPELLK